MKRVLLNFILALAALPALADSINGKLAIAGIDTFTTTSITFHNPAVVLLATNDFGVINGDLSININSQPSFSAEVGTTLFDWNHLGADINAKILSFDVIQDSSNFLNVLGTVLVSRTGETPTVFDFSLTSSRPDGTTSFALDAAPPVSEPATWLMLGTGIFSMCLLFYARRKGVKI